MTKNTFYGIGLIIVLFLVVVVRYPWRLLFSKYKEKRRLETWLKVRKQAEPKSLTQQAAHADFESVILFISIGDSLVGPW